jgi:DNA-binding LacI/PurR family transcriptional regulator
MLDVSPVTAHRAMRLLAERDILVRQRKAGTFIGAAVSPPPDPPARKMLHFIVSYDVGRDRAAALDYLSNELVSGVVEALPGVSIQIDIVGPEDRVSVASGIIEGARAKNDFAGAILVRSSLEAQRRFAESGLPTVIYGTVYPGIEGMASLDVDHHRIGQLTAEYVLRSRRRRLTTLMFSHWAPGDNVFMSAYLTTLQACHEDVLIDIRSIPPDDQVIAEEATTLFARRDPPDIIVARSPSLLRQLAEEAVSHGLRVPEDVEVVIGNHLRFDFDGKPVPGARCRESLREEGRRLGVMLLAASSGGSDQVEHAIVPVEFMG